MLGAFLFAFSLVVGGVRELRVDAHERLPGVAHDARTRAVLRRDGGSAERADHDGDVLRRDGGRPRRLRVVGMVGVVRQRRHRRDRGHPAAGIWGQGPDR